MSQPHICSGDQKYVLYWWEKEKDKRCRREKSKRVAWWPMYRSHKRFYACGLTVNNLDFLSRSLWPWDWRSKWIQARDREKEQMVLGRYGSWNEQRYKQKTNSRWSRAWEALQPGKPGMFKQPGLCGPPTSQAAILTSLSSTVSTSAASHSTLLLFPAESTLAHKPLPKHPSLLFTGHTLFIHEVIPIFCSHCIQNLCE